MEIVMLKKYTSEIIAALSHLLLRVMVLLLIEDECAQLVQQSSGQPAVLGNYILIGLFALGFLLILILPSKKIGYIVGTTAGIVNIIAKVVILIIDSFDKFN
jgi:hypothetical protein